MGKYYEITLSARHLWMIILLSTLFLLASFSLGVWVGGYSPPGQADSGYSYENSDTVTEFQEIESSMIDNVPVPPPGEELESRSVPPNEEKKNMETKNLSESQSGRDGIWTVQVLAVQNGSAAQKWLQKLLAEGYDAYMETLTHPSGKNLYRIRIGKFETRQLAEKELKKISEDAEVRKEKLKPWITRR